MMHLFVKKERCKTCGERVLLVTFGESVILECCITLIHPGEDVFSTPQRPIYTDRHPH